MGNSVVNRIGRGGRSLRTRIAAFGALVALVATAVVVIDPAPGAEAASPCGPDINAIVCENQQPGTDPEVWDITGAGDPTIQGFATDISVNAGERIDFKIDTDASAYAIDVYRTGWYQGLGARKVASVTPSASLPQNQPECISDVTTELYDCGTWGVSASWNVPSDAVSGVYIAKLTRADDGGSSHIIFIVRKDGSTSDVLFQTSDPTWHAYNKYGGSDFYQGAGNRRAYKISYNRPFATRDGVEARDFYFASEYATVRFLERNGYDVSYIAGVDTDRRGGELLNHNVFLSVGHDEYWSGAQRANMEAARDAGVNFQFLTGNEGYWRTRYEPSADGASAPYRTLVSYKETWNNNKIDPSSEWTGTWRDPRFADASAGGHLPENGLTGTMYFVNDVDLPVTVSDREGKLRLWRNTALASMAPGASAELAAHTVGYESNEDVDNGFRPAGLVRLSTTIGPTPQYLTDYGNIVVPGTTEHHLTLYRAPSGALVFSSASVQWGWGLDATHDGDGAPADPRMQQAQVNLLADMGAQPGSLMPGLVAATASADTTAPTTVITAPTEGATVANGTSVTISGTAADVGGRVAGVEVSTDGGQTWHPAEGTTSWTYTYLQQGHGAVNLVARAIDDSGNYSAAGTSRAVTVAGPYSAFGDAVPAIASANDSQPVELGLRFTPDVDGFIAAVRFYKGTANTGTHVGSLWDAAGTLLGSVNFVDETASGWQVAQFTAPIQVIAGQTYTVSYTAPNGGYAMQERYWPYTTGSSPVTVSPAVGAASAGVYGHAGTFPANAWGESNYFVDVLFTKSDTSPLRILDRSPAAGVSSVPLDAAVSATFTRPADPASVSLAVAGPDGSPAAGTVSYDAATKTVRFVPAVAWAARSTYTVTPQATDMAGVALEPGAAWSFTTQGADLPVGQCPCSLFSESRVPTIVSDTDRALVTLGVKFTVTEPGNITALKFYKGAANTGTHTGTLWDASGNPLASVTFENESTAGWQIAQLSTPVSVQPGIEYVASYVAPNGAYSATPGAFGSAYTRGPLSVPASGGVFTYSQGFPSSTSSTDYGVDVVFERGEAVVSLVSTSPANAATDVSRTSNLTATFDAAIRDDFTGTVTASGASVPGSWTLSSDGKTATFDPSGSYPAGAVVSVSLTGIHSASGQAAPDAAWWFQAAGTSTTVTLLGTSTPTGTETSDTASVELGMAFTAAVAGEVTAIRFYKAPGNTGTHVGSLWNAAGQRVAQVTFQSESASGWQRAVLSSPVALVAGAVYTVSYVAPHGGYSYTGGAFASPVTNGPLTAVSPENGRYRYGSGGVVPTNSWNSTNYFVDVEFVPSASPGEPALAVTSRTPAAGATDVAAATAISATLNRAPAGQAVSMTLTGPSGSVTGTASFDAGSRVVSFAPQAPLSLASAYTATVTVDGLALDSWSFQTEEPPQSGDVQNLFGSAVPDIAAVVDNDAIEVGTAFTVAKAGNATAIRFFKGATNSGAHRGTLWGPNGEVLAQVNFVAETASGWQRAPLSTPVALQPGVTYVVSYFSTSGYAYTAYYFAETRTSGDITGPGGANGRFTYGANGGYPTSTWAATSYFVDAEIDFGAAAASPPASPFVPTPEPSPAPTPPAPSVPEPTPVAVTSTTPGSAAGDVAPTTTISATLDVDAAATLAVSGPSGAVAGTSSYDSATRTVTFTPATPLAWSAAYTASVAAENATVTGGGWSFQTAAAPPLVDAQTLFGEALPQHAWWEDPDAIQVATRFTVATAGTAEGIRFYKGAANTGLHTGYLWSADGQKLAEVEFVGETADGWQTARFVTSVNLQPGTEYRVGLHSTTGRYAVDLGTLAAETVVGPFTIPAAGSAYGYSREFPAATSAHNYWVDVLFVPAD